MSIKTKHILRKKKFSVIKKKTSHLSQESYKGLYNPEPVYSSQRNIKLKNEMISKITGKLTSYMHSA